MLTFVILSSILIQFSLCFSLRLTGESLFTLTRQNVNNDMKLQQIKELPVKPSLSSKYVVDFKNGWNHSNYIKYSLLSLFVLPGVSCATDLNSIYIAKPVIDTFVNVLSVLFLCRTIISWYPNTDIKKFPYSIIMFPTEALQQPLRSIIPPAFGVDISALIWIMLLSFVREILTGQQGILTLMEKSVI